MGKIFYFERKKFLEELKKMQIIGNLSSYLKELFYYEKILYTENETLFLELVN